MAKNIINLENVRGYAQYGDDYSDILEQKRKKKKLEAERENASLGEKILGTVADVSGNILQGGLNAFEGVSDWARYRYADVMDLFGADEAAEKARARARENDIESAVNSFKRITQGDLSGSKSDEEIYYNDFVNRNSIIDEDTKILGANARNVFQGIGNTLGYAAMTGYFGKASAGAAELGTSGKILKGASDLAPIYMSAAGGGQTEAYLEGATDAEASLYGTFSGLIEAGTESLFGGLGKAADKLGVSKALGLGKGALDDKLIGSLTKRFRSTLVKNLVDLGFRGAGEGVEEVLSDFFGAFAKKMTYLKEEDLGKLIKDPNYLESFMSGTLSSVLSQGGANVSATFKGQETTTGITKNENKVVEAVVEERTKGKNLTNKEIQNIRNEVREDLQNGYISTDTIEQVLGQDYDRSNDTYLQESYNEKARKQASFNTDLNQYKNENQRKIVQKAIDSGILNDSKKTHNFVDLVSKIAADKGMDFDFTNNERIKESGFGVEGKTVNGYVNGNTIGLNIESNNALNKTVGHEITHVLEGSDMYQALQDSLKSYIGEAQWNKRISELSETYKNVENADVTKELTADLVGENLFNNEDFVRSLSTKDRNLFQKIFDEIKYLVKIATAGSKEKRELVKLQKVFQEAYRDSKTTKEGTKYQVEGKEEVSLSYAKQRFNRNMGKYEIGDNLEDAYLEHQLRKEELDSLYEYAKKKAYNDSELKELERRYNELVERDNPNQAKYSLTDNQGRELSKEQQEYFKDSKIRNDNGELETVYHTTPNQFTIFDSDRAGENTGYDNTAFGSFVTTNRNFSERFGDINEEGTKGNTMEMYANITNPITHPYNAEYKYSGEQLDNIVENWFNAIGETEALEELKSYVEDGEYDSLYQAYRNTVEFSDESPFEYASDERERLQEKGYDGVEFVEGLDKDVNYNVSDSNEPVSSYAVFDSNQLKNIDNSKPTSNPDIRYSLSADAETFTTPYGVEVVKNPSNDDYIEMRKEILDEYPWLRGQEPILRHTYDEEGNEYYWSAYDAQHASVEPYINKKYNTRTNQNDGWWKRDNKNDYPKDYSWMDLSNFNPDSNVKYSLSNTDSQGKELSQGQKDFFKDVSSEVKDENNNLMRFYHGSNSEFTIFDINKGGQSNSNADVGFWFTPNVEGAKNFADSVWYGDKTPTTYEVYLDMKNPKIYESFDNTETTERLKQQRDAVYKEMQNLQSEYAYESLSLSNVVYYMEMMNEKELADNLVKNFHYKEDNVKKTIEDAKKYIEVREKYNNLERQTADSRYTDSYEQFRTDIYKLAGKSAEDANTGGTGMALDNKSDYVKQYVENLKNEGYDGIVIKNTRYDANTMGDNNNQYVVFEPNQIKNITNENPTSNPDIRYSLTDDKGRTLSENQQIFFNESIVRDKEGNLKTYYNGSDNFNIFNKNFMSDSSKWGKGIYLTEYEDIAKNYGADLKESYVNITNPLYDNKKTITFDQYNELYKRLYDGDEAYREEYDMYNNDLDLLWDITNKGSWADYAQDIKETTGKDGIIINRMDDVEDMIIAFQSNQVKRVSNLNPTDDPDIRYQLGTNEIAPTQGWDVRGRDIALEQALAPVKEQLNQLQDIVQELAPITEQEAANLPVDENIELPTRYNLTADESQELDELEQLPFDMTDEQQERYDELRAKEVNEPTGEDMTPIESLTDVRDMDEVARDRSANAYQYEHPEVKPYFQEEARVLLAEINEVIPGERFMIEGRDYEHPTEWKGYKRQASEDVANLLDGYTLGTKYTKDQLRDGLRAIIEDHGAENKAVSKRLEFMLDDRLRNGYDTIEGYHIEPNADYLNMLREQSWDKYYEEAPWSDNVPAEIENDVITVEPTIRRDEIAPVRETRDITEMLEQQEFRQDTQRKQPKVQPKPRNAIQRAWDSVMSGWVNRNVLGDRLARQSKNQQIKYNYDAFNNYIAEAQYNINGNQTNYNFESVGDGLNKIFNDGEKLGIPKAVLNEFLIDQENCDRWKIGKGSQTPYEESARRLRDYAIQYPEIKKWAKRVWQFGANSLQNRVDAGLMTQDQADGLRKSHPHYVPFFAEQDNIDTAFNQINELKAGGLKRAKGGAGEVMPVYDALSKYVNAEKKAIRFNDTLKEIIHTLGETNNFGTDERTDSTDISKNLFTDNGNYYITAYEDGRQITAKVSKEFFKELSRETENRIKEIEDNMSLLVKPLQAMNEFNRNIHTSLSLSFPVKNAIKDFGSALFNSKHTMKMLKNYNLGTIRELVQGKSKDAQQFLAGYGSGLTMGEYGNDTINQKLKNNKFLKGIRNLNNYIELMPRFAEFKASRQSGENIQQSLYNAREVTMNFSRGGTVAKAINRDGITFFNTSVQGFDKLLRNFSGENGAKGVALALTKVAMLGILPAVFNDLAFGGGSDDEDEDYKALPNYIKDNYYLIKKGDGEFIRIPKSQPLAVIGSAARRTMEAARGEENAFEGFTKNAVDQIGVNNPLQNNVFAPLIQAFGSENGTAWYGGDIVPSRLQDEDVRDQYDASVDKFSIWLGEKLGVSPYKINYVIDQYSGGIGDIALPLITDEAKNEGGILAPIRDQFVVNSTTDNKYVSQFYSTREKIPTGKRATDDDILQKKYLDSVSTEMAELYAERREVQADNSLSRQEKFEKAQEIKKEINKLAQEALENYKNVTVNGDYANVDGKEYQRDENGWKKVNNTTSEELSSMGLNSSEKDTYFKTKNDISNIKNQYKDSKDYAAKKSSIINEIRKSDLPDDAKIALYNDTYNDKMADKYTDVIDTDSYLDFKSQTFTADKDKDGKSISGSKKQKVFDYVNSMNIPFEQKVMLVKSEYPTYNEYNQEIINYLNNDPNIDYQTMVDILEDLGFKVNGDSISW